MATNSILPLPPIAILAESAAELVSRADSATQAHALNKAAFYLHQGVEIIPTTGGFLVPSGTRGGVVHRVSTVHGCSCEAGANGKACWHAALLTIIEAAQTRAIPVADRIAARRKTYAQALAEINELF
jgi:hypothetical protein